MAGPIWLALIFLVGICAVAALKINIATPPKQQAAFAEDVIETPVNALVKTDKLEVEEIPDKKTIRSIAIVPQTRSAQRAVMGSEDGPHASACLGRK
jgi:hypothetical protein